MERSIGYQIPFVIEGHETTSVGDVTVDKEYTDVELKRKGSRRTGHMKGMYDITLDFDIDKNPKDEAYLVLEAAQDSDDYIEVAIGDIIEDKFIITKFSENEPTDDIVTVNISLRLATEDAEHFKMPEPPKPPEP
jgi:hypothetical protein